jgi:hypothetical protein
VTPKLRRHCSTAEALPRASECPSGSFDRSYFERRIPFLKIGHFLGFEADEVEHWIEAHRVVSIPPEGARLRAVDDGAHTDAGRISTRGTQRAARRG